MNLLDATVVQVIDDYEFRYGKWFVPVLYDCWGRVQRGEVMVDTEEDAKAVKKGYTFLT